MIYTGKILLLFFGEDTLMVNPSLPKGGGIARGAPP
jgi:hypothetical protein